MKLKSQTGTSIGQGSLRFNTYLFCSLLIGSFQKAMLLAEYLRPLYTAQALPGCNEELRKNAAAALRYLAIGSSENQLEIIEQRGTMR